jgi:signal transduction protein with GAF and PtsI domain
MNQLTSSENGTLFSTKNLQTAATALIALALVWLLSTNIASLQTTVETHNKDTSTESASLLVSIEKLRAAIDQLNTTMQTNLKYQQRTSLPQ